MSMEEKTCVSKYFQDEYSKMTNSPENSVCLPPGENSLNSSQCSIEADTNTLSLLQLTLEEMQPIIIQPYYNITPRKMPVSPHDVLEEHFSSNPWAMLIATIFLTKTSAKTARPYMRDFFDTYPTPYHVINDNPTNLERFFDNLGLKKRGPMIWKCSYQFVSSKWRRASDLCGIGKYGEDAYRIFCLGHTDLDPNDRYLKLYLDWLRRTEFLEENGAIDSEHVIEDPVTNYYKISLNA